MAHAELGHHVTPTRTLSWNLIWLLALMFLTVFAARVWHILSPMPANFLMLAIACMKAYLVVSIFMGVKYTTKLAKLFAIGGFVWFLLLFGTLIDYWTRPWEPVKGWEEAPSTSLPRTKDVPE